MRKLTKKPRVSEPPRSADNPSISVPLLGLTCLSCVIRLERQLQKLETVEHARISIRDEKAELEVSSIDGALPDVIRTIQEAGFEPRLTRVFIPMPGLPASSPAIETLERELSSTPGISRSHVDRFNRILVADFLPGTIDVNSIRSTVHRFGYATSHPRSTRLIEKGETSKAARRLFGAMIPALLASILCAPLISEPPAGFPDAAANAFVTLVRQTLPALFDVTRVALQWALLVLAAVGIIAGARHWIVAGLRALTARAVDTNVLSMTAGLILTSATLALATQPVLFPGTPTYPTMGVVTLLWTIVALNAIRILEEQLRVIGKVQSMHSEQDFSVGFPMSWSPLVLGVTPVLMALWFIFGTEPAFAISVAAGCGFLVAFSTDLASEVYLRRLRESGRLFAAKGAEPSGTDLLLRLSSVETVAVYDKGLITTGDAEVSDFVLLNGSTQAELLRTAASISQLSSGRQFQAIARRAKLLEGISRPDRLTDESVGGISGSAGSSTVHVGTLGYLTRAGFDVTSLEDEAQESHRRSKSFSAVVVDGSVLGGMATREPTIPGVPLLVERLHAVGLKVHLLTAEDDQTAETRAREAGMDGVTAGLSAADEPSALSSLRGERGAVAFVSRGSSHRGAGSRSDVSISVSEDDATSQDADLVLRSGAFDEVVSIIELSRTTLARARKLRSFAIMMQCGLALIGAQVLFPATGKLIPPPLIGLGLLIAMLLLRGLSRRALPPEKGMLAP